jgi:type II secretory pathway pseudopilin PulG
MAVVLTILVILATLVTTAATGVLNSSRRQTTMSTQQILEQAITEFASSGSTVSQGRYGKFPPDGYYLDVDDEEFTDVNGNGIYDLGEPVTDDLNGNGIYDRANLLRDLGAIQLQWRAGNSWDTKGIPTEDYMSIEAMVLYCRRLSPAAAKLIDGLSSGQITNDDKLNGQPRPDAVVIDSNRNGTVDVGDERVDLNEVADAWDNPIRYRVRVGRLDPGDPITARWELRSAGPDERFADPFTNENLSDDVVLTGQ